MTDDAKTRHWRLMHLVVVQRQPNCGFFAVRPLDAMAGMGWDEYMVAWSQDTRFRFALDEQPSTTLKQHYPLRAILVEPFAGWGGLPIGNDPLRHKMLGLEQLLDSLGGVIGR